MDYIFSDAKEYDEYVKSNKNDDFIDFEEWLNLKYANKKRPWE